MALVIGVAILAFSKDGVVGTAAGIVRASASTGPVEEPPATPPAEPSDAEPEKPAPVRQRAEAAGRSHTVQEGETLTSLAVRYYGDRSRTLHLFRANQDRLLAPDKLTVGMVLVIPDSPAKAESMSSNQ
jgi:nucleoid-associated protein YgaU